ncbi:MAG: hypothetical protein IPG28_01290 [Betaproteobacteria bacterium]|jgi:hypothetical protein|nr:hypothetical protein [Betaproteobacteria bacterium]MBK7080691.1 hypothetical protein [Betaproteobacteria bacterium]MBK7590894.1 hypothetical protein [Betaproteobacteria bacterium]MBK7742393.1 hypothetical protein [Betaproteobacteria bacterium]MBK8690411.1 hypothetical protein [Betaproteobacteria bacterium]
MNYDLHSRTEKTVFAGVAAMITAAGLTLIVSGFLPADDHALLARQQFLEARFETLRVARDIASGEVRQAAAEPTTQTH